MNKNDVELIISKIDFINEKIANCDSLDELKLLQKERMDLAINTFMKIKTKNT